MTALMACIVLNCSRVGQAVMTDNGQMDRAITVGYHHLLKVIAGPFTFNLLEGHCKKTS